MTLLAKERGVPVSQISFLEAYQRFLSEQENIDKVQSSSNINIVNDGPSITGDPVVDEWERKLYELEFDLTKK